jgi:hypothetical protein
MITHGTKLMLTYLSPSNACCADWSGFKILIPKGSGNDGIAKQPNHYGALGWFDFIPTRLPARLLIG